MEKVDEEALRTFVNNVKIGETVDCTPWRFIIEAAALNGRVLCEWTTLRKLFCIEFMNSLQKLVREEQNASPPISYEYEGENLPMRRTRVLIQISRWTSPPFTTQRLAEILLDQHRPPSQNRWYKTANSFLLSFTRCVLGISPSSGPNNSTPQSEIQGRLSSIDASVIYFNSRGDPIQIVDDDNDQVALLTLSRNPSVSSTLLSKSLCTPVQTPAQTPVSTAPSSPSRQNINQATQISHRMGPHDDVKEQSQRIPGGYSPSFSPTTHMPSRGIDQTLSLSDQHNIAQSRLGKENIKNGSEMSDISLNGSTTTNRLKQPSQSGRNDDFAMAD